MDEAKPWQIGLFLAGLLVLVGSLVWQCGRDEVPIADRLTLVDVTTGRLYEGKVDPERNLFLPVRHPETGEATLFPVRQDDGGSWRISERYRRQVEELKGAAVENAEDGTFKLADNGKVTRIDLYKRRSGG